MIRQNLNLTTEPQCKLDYHIDRKKLPHLTIKDKFIQQIILEYKEKLLKR